MTRCLSGREDKKDALELDYEVVQNYWPTLEFQGDDWAREVSQWSLDPSKPPPEALKLKISSRDDPVSA